MVDWACAREIDPDASNSAKAVLRRGGFFFQAEDGIRDLTVTGVQTCALPIYTTNKFRGDFYECSAKIAVSVTTPSETGHGFHFESDPATSHTDFAQFGTEHNGEIGRASCRERV